jgi:hypothetical protein
MDMDINAQIAAGELDSYDAIERAAATLTHRCEGLRRLFGRTVRCWNAKGTGEHDHHCPACK